ncbi:methionine--tRNA ligase, mitochondrial-like [Physella acuta]|uniref:methionine--tRNA ligase, mitochondrial-like n=1 Tax=Physella acuta TaxID=109671 RepID=UPI0027DD4669|nr:methionine--tRNA ligase, mitochondrial-like [Physella acuta]
MSKAVTSLTWQLASQLMLHNRTILFRCCHTKHVKKREEKLSSPFFVTTPIFYVNAAPHIGHLYTCLLADVVTRWNKLKGNPTFFSTGTDEHGLKIQQAAATQKLEPEEFTSQIAKQFINMFDAAGLQYDRFIRTSEQAHIEAVQAFWTRLYERGHIYPSSYAGWYSVSDEAFLSDLDVEDKSLPDGSTVKISKASGHPVTWFEENNYMFRLSEFQQALTLWLNSCSIVPHHFEPIVRHMIQSLPDLSVTRDRSRVPWGIPVPNDDTQTIYVWLDALVNYLTVTGYPNTNWGPWPPSCQIIGKDILKFHAVYWPAFLIAAGYKPPEKLVVHSHWLVDNVKMSKSLGNVIDPVDKMQIFGVDGLRFFLLKEGSIESDSSYSEKRMVERLNTDLANTLGNLLGRLTAPSVNKTQSFVALNPDHMFEFLTVEEREFFKSTYDLAEQVDFLYRDLNLGKCISLIFSHLHWANTLVQGHQPWQLSQSTDPADTAHLHVVLHVAMETLRVCGILLQPIIPSITQKLLNRLGVPENERSYSNACTPALSGYKKLGPKEILQKKIILDTSGDLTKN